VRYLQSAAFSSQPHLRDDEKNNIISQTKICLQNNHFLGPEKGQFGAFI
jgi:hypothetical protein